jgi:hypothetical protein
MDLTIDRTRRPQRRSPQWWRWHNAEWEPLFPELLPSTFNSAFLHYGQRPTWSGPRFAVAA